MAAVGALTSKPRELMLLDKAKRALVEATSIDEVKDIRDKAAAVQAYARQRGDSLAVLQHAGEIKLRAERRAGELLAGTPKNRGAATRSHDVIALRLDEIGITPMQSHRWQLAAEVPEEEFEAFVAKSVESERELTSAGLLKIAKANRARKTVETRLSENSIVEGCTDDFGDLLASGVKFATVYADPPWQYDNQATRASTDKHYDTMTVEAIASLPVPMIIADNAHLYLWTTNAFLFQSKEIIERWGFEYKSCFVWVKPQMGIGNYWRLSHEFLLLGVRGSAPVPPEAREKSWSSWDRLEHSQKPEEARLMIERMSIGPRVELFGRVPCEGWQVFGNQIEPRLFAK